MQSPKNMLIKRAIQSRIEAKFFQGKAIIIYGPRQVGKTTLIKMLEKKYFQNSVFYNCDEPDVRRALTDVNSAEIKSLIGVKKVIFLDEAQRIKNIGLTLKLIVDNFAQVQVVATGSSSFDLSNEIVEPLTGRKYEFYLFPFSLGELSLLYSLLETKRLLGERIVFGMYPEVVLKKSEANGILREITKSYLYKDVLEYQQIKNPEILEKLLQALALQTGSEVSYNELAKLLGVDKKTVSRYIELLEKAFVLFRLRPYSRNLRKELTKLRKIYFFDTGIRNALINNLNPLDLRQDTGGLWENFIISERIKQNSNFGFNKNLYFWRAGGREIDLLESEGDSLRAFEFKWKKQKFNPPKLFLETYKKSKIKLVHQENFQEFIDLKLEVQKEQLGQKS